ncbi:hypothetical protein V7S43_008561 [Phytophthora oleae]|uniref:Uncharacterized protein n=1 Tax=Phytophthora oleae TaxID=2107226 RepID=A0ABD3FL58_9STRA
MNRDGLPTRHQESPLTRRNRDIPPPTNTCLEVQWRFLQHKNPKPPQFGSPSRKPLLIDPLNPERLDAKASSRQPKTTHPAPPGSPSRLFQMFETQEVDSGDGNITITAPQQENSLPESPRASRTLNDLMGETQRQAMLDRILADMEYLAVEPMYSRLGQSESAKASSPRKSQRARSHKPSILHTALRKDSNISKHQVQPKQRRFSVLWSLASQGDYADDMDDLDDDDDLDSSQTNRDDSKRRQRRKLRQFIKVDEEPRIFWQKTDGARSAVDVPERLLTLSPSPPRRMRSAHIVLGRRSRTPRQLLSPSTTIDRSRESLMGGSTSPQPSPQATSTAKSLVRRKLRLPAATPPVRIDKLPASPPKARYGSWYVPQSEWWELRQLEQQTIADKFPPSAISTDETHCHSGNTSPAQRQHKPPLPPAALYPRGHDSSQAKVPVAVSTGTGRLSSASSRTPPSAPGPLELQVASIPQSYIGREYRAFIISTGSAMPQYLQ